MDEIVARSMARWPNVPAVYGWLQLDRRGNWRIKGERIANAALREFIARNYQADERGCWYFQNGPQRVFVELAYTPLVVHFEGEALLDHCARPFRRSAFCRMTKARSSPRASRRSRCSTTGTCSGFPSARGRLRISCGPTSRVASDSSPRLARNSAKKRGNSLRYPGFLFIIRPLFWLLGG